MVWTFEKLLIELCAPTLMGVKPASLFRYQADDITNVYEEVDSWNKQLYRHGITITILKECQRQNSFLIYVYRKSKLSEILQNQEVKCFLKEQHYDCKNGIDGYLQTLSTRLCMNQDFPHEIGIFLGYPLDDVIGFIENEGKNCTLCGDWKVYHNPHKAMRQFNIFKKCTQYCKERFAHGATIVQLAVAA